MTERDAVTSALACPAENARATSAGVAPCAPTPGSRIGDCGRSRRASEIARGCVAPTTAPTLDRPFSPSERLAPLAHELGDVVPQRAPVRKREILDVGRARVRRANEEEHAGAVATTGGEEGLDRVEPEVGAGRHRVRERGRVVAWLEVRRGVRARRGADVSALRVEQDEETGGTRVGADLLERAEAVGAERLEERGLRLHGDDVRPDRVDDALAEARHR